MNSTIEILNEVTHRDLKINFVEAKSVSLKERFLPVVISEFHSLMFHYPIIFVKDKETGEFACSVLLGINSTSNLLDDKDLTNNDVLPLNIRRLPLIAVAPPADDNAARPLIADNMSSPGVGQGEHFLKNKSEAFESAISALVELYDGHKETRSYIKKIVELDLISKLNVEIRYPDKPNLTLEGLYGIDTNKIAHVIESNAASKDLFLEIASYVYAQNFSLYNMKKLAPISS
ncbi:MAG: hypothetical protein EOO07_10330 [Chitinophagaceae bacterium]|nr:MAG: hypothetical protein EOO07_10330 [Chitinophagaceae bacterium]